MKTQIIATAAALTFNLLSLQALAVGGGDGAGGGPVVYQAKAIQAFLSESDLLFMFVTDKAFMINSVEFKSAANGVSQYVVVSNGGCTVNATTTPSDKWGMKYKVSLGAMKCP